MIIYLNGIFEDGHQASISIWDAGFLFGEGVFTTLRLYNGDAPDLQDHWQRLATQAAELDIPFPLTLPHARELVHELAQRNNLTETDARLRITLTRGGDPEHPMAMAPSPKIEPTILATLTALSPDMDQENRRGIPVITLGADFQRRHLPTLKSLNALPSLLALREAHKKGCPEAIVLDENGLITEGAVSNLFLVKDNTLLTPQDRGRILPGQTRQRVLRMAAHWGLKTIEKDLTMKDLIHADEVFLCNSIREIVPVIRIDEFSVNHGKPGPVTLQMWDSYRQAVRSG